MGIEFPDGSRMSAKYADEACRSLGKGLGYVLYRRRTAVKGAPTKKGLDKNPQLPYRSVRKMGHRLTENKAKVLKAIDEGYDYGYAVYRYAGLGDIRTTYRTLYALEAEGLVVPREEALERARSQGRPPRTFYRLTFEGRKALARAEEKYPSALAKLSFASEY